jgi:hypothetical protein
MELDDWTIDDIKNVAIILSKETKDSEQIEMDYMEENEDELMNYNYNDDEYVATANYHNENYPIIPSVIEALNTKISLAKFYEINSLKVFRLCTIIDGTCNCYKKQDCPAPGKHPFGRSGFKEASLDYEFIKGCNSDIYNIGITTGEMNNLLVLDFDPKNGGDISFTEKLENSPYFMKTLKVFTGSFQGRRGFHFYYRLPEGKSITTKNSSEFGVDLKANGGYVVGPGSRHNSGVVYEHDSSSGNSIETLTQEALDFILNTFFSTNANERETDKNKKAPNSSSAASILESSILEGGRNLSLYKYACRLVTLNLKQPEVIRLIHILNRHLCAPPLESHEVDNLLNSALTHRNELVLTPNWPEDRLEGPLAEIASETTNGTEVFTPSVYTLLIVLLGNYIGLKAKYKNVAGYLQTNLFMVLIGLTKNGKKGAAQSIAEKVFRLTLKENDPWFSRIKKGLKTPEALVDSISDKQFGSEKNNKTNTYETIEVFLGEEDKRLMSIETEFSKILKESSKSSSTMSEVLRQAYDGEALATLTKSNKRSTSKSHVSFIGHITPSEYEAVRRTEDNENGFVNRFIHVYSDAGEIAIAFPRTFSDWNMNIINNMVTITEWINNQEEITFSMNEEAKKMWISFYTSHRLTKRSVLIDSINARNDNNVLKISMVLAAADCSDIIRKDHLERAISIIDYNIQTTEYIYHTDDEKDEANISKIVNFIISNKGKVTRSSILRECFKKNKNKNEIDALKELCIQKRKIAVTREGNTEYWSVM